MKKIWLICAILGLLIILLFGTKILTFGPWLIILICPLMHIFMMKGMSHSDKKDRAKDKSCH